MSVLITCGFSSDACAFAEERLNQMGLKAPIKSERLDFSPVEFSEKVYLARQAELGENNEFAAINPGKAWEIWAADMIISNFDEAPWGWAEPRNINFLQFWKELDPTINFILLFESPQQSFARALLNNEVDASEKGLFLGRWRRYYGEIVQFYTENEDRCVLINLDALEFCTQELCSLIDRKFDIQLMCMNDIALSEQSPILELFSDILMKGKIETDETWAELQLCADLLETEKRSRDQLLQKAFEEFRSFSMAERRLDDANAELSSLKIKMAEAEARSGNADRDNTEVDYEKALLIKQLHQVQEELELYFTKYQNLKLEGSVATSGQAAEDSQQSQTIEQTSLPKPEEVSIDLCSYLNGSGWHSAEGHGRWAGEQIESTIEFPAMNKADYLIEIEVVDGMELDILHGLELRIDDHALKKKVKILSNIGGRLAHLRRMKANAQKVPKPYPAIISARWPSHLVSPERAYHTLKLTAPRTISPAQFGESDARDLSVCVSNVKIEKLR